MKMIAVMVTAGAALVLWSAPVLAHQDAPYLQGAKP